MLYRSIAGIIFDPNAETEFKIMKTLILIIRYFVNSVFCLLTNITSEYIQEANNKTDAIKASNL